MLEHSMKTLAHAMGGLARDDHDKNAPKRCRWVIADRDYGAWETKCGDVFQLISGTPQENDMKFCPYCGGELVTDESKPRSILLDNF